MREGLLCGMVEDTLVERAGTLGLEPEVVREALTMHVDELLHTRGVLRLVKAQINGMMPGVYFGLLLPVLIIALLVALEIWAAKRFGWTRQGAPSAPVEPSPRSAAFRSTLALRAMSRAWARLYMVKGVRTNGPHPPSRVRTHRLPGQSPSVSSGCAFQ
ncbi:hypothetical protein N5J56_17450 [Stenotrophomonas sp. GD03657]|nr:hypothetical protein [Stenotrophomonas sp. GD03657]MDH2157098.1 hypothetical protein [Stenotrophomonas sp. GD03657]